MQCSYKPSEIRSISRIHKREGQCLYAVSYPLCGAGATKIVFLHTLRSITTREKCIHSGDYENTDAVENEVETASKTREECLQVSTPVPTQTPTTPAAPYATPSPTSTAEPAAPVAPPTTTDTPSPVDPVPSPVDPTPSPVVDPTPSPVLDPTPSPVLDPTPSPVDPMPEPEDPTPAPADPTPAPSSTPGPVQPSPGVGACDPNPCLKGGSCEEDPSGGYVCSCPGGQGGMHCDTDTAGEVKNLLPL